jgi:hypothetical protein
MQSAGLQHMHRGVNEKTQGKWAVMAGLRVHPIQGALACLSLLAFLSIGEALAQSSPPTPAILRLAQVAVRLPHVYLFASAQDESGRPFLGRWGKPSTLIGPTYTDAQELPPEGMAIVFLIDISGSVHPPQFKMIRDSVQRWIEALGPADQAAIVTFGSSVAPVVDFTADQRALIGALGRLPQKPSDPDTLLYQGLVQAIDLSRRLDRKLPRLRRAIVVLTDGIDDQKGGAGRQEVLDKLAVDPVPIYGIGASTDNNAKDKAKVDAALKDFAGLVRASGGEYRPGDIRNPDEGFNKLHDIVSKTKLLIAECPRCVPDGSPIVVRLFMSYEDTHQTRLSSESVTARSVDLEGNVKPPSPPVQTPVTPWWKELLDFLADLPPAWKAILALLASGSIASVPIRIWFPDFPGRILILVLRRPKPPVSPPPETTKPASDNSVVVIPRPLSVSPGTGQDRQRLRLYPIGHNEIGPFDILFEKTLAVGRSPENQICIPNDGQVSATHCTISPSGKAILVQDSGSRNGTRVNGVPINGFLHAEPDSTLGVGRTELRMKLLPVGAR